MADLETVNGVSDIVNPIYRKQRENVAKMRASLLSCSDDPATSRQAMQNITVLQVYHQVARVIRYLELMDKLEDKLYESIEHEIDTADIQDEVTWVKLLTIQSKLQKAMLDSHKLLEPYLDSAQDFQVVQMAQAADTTDAKNLLMDASSRDKLRNSAKAILKALGEGDFSGGE